MTSRYPTIGLLFAALFVLVSCAGPPEVGIVKDTLYDRPMPKVEYEYELGPGDIVEIVYHYTPKPDRSDYYLAVGDIIQVEFAYHGAMDRKLSVRPDGNISMPRKGDVYVLGLTPKQLQEKLTQIYSKDFRNPVITITMVQYNTAIEHLKKAITTAPRGQSKLTTVRPDGYLAFPMLPDILAKGKSMPQISEMVNREYSRLIDNLTVSLFLQEMKANLVYVMGEVEKPDYYLMEGPNTVSQIVARAGGALDSAETSTILVISRDEKRRPWGRLVNLVNIVHDGDISQDIVLSQYDVVYVPKNAIARANLWVEQYINGMVPEFFDASYNVGGTLVDHKPVIK